MAFVGGKCVLNATGTGGHPESGGYDQSSLQIVFSSSKVLTSLVVAMLVDRELLCKLQA